MTKTARHRLLKPLHRTLTVLATTAGWLAGALERLAAALGSAAAKCDPARGTCDFVELRDALTGEPLGMTKAQYRRYVLALGTRDPETIARAAREVQERRRRVLASWAGVACLALSWGCTKGNGGLRLCVPGQQQECACPGGQRGAQACLEDGSGFAACLGCAEAQDLAQSASLDLAGVDLAQPDFHGIDFSGGSIPDLANPAFTGIACGTATCGPVGGNLGCCAQVGNGTSTMACYPDTTACPPSNQAVALCDGPEDCAPGTKCAFSLSADKDAGLTVAENRCRPDGSFTVKATATTQTSTLTTVSCHSNDDCVGVSGSMPSVGVVPFSSCCHYAGYPRGFCINAAASANPIVCP